MALVLEYTTKLLRGKGAWIMQPGLNCFKKQYFYMLRNNGRKNDKCGNFWKTGDSG